ncbi:MAG: phosphatase PAP2 family protein [Halomonas sp.]|nr:phosphatase PAP2 family protein [Halomonas sp.]MDN6298156.1 phosphatase PAP2 family protein [Halomonas sp.]MDN6315266.1 phosphatase PAP2 family protein [Halomonas sp.]MDN6336624.1 phosphatase PAP2 family protein [Halomonas sp.]
MLSRRILLFNALGVALLLSWALPSFTLWTYLDDGVFWFFNHTISDNHPRWNVVLAALNNRKYDMLIMLAMLVTMAAASYRDQQGGFRRWFGIGVTMLITAGLINELVRTVVTYSHPSPTRFFDDANLLSQFVHFATKDQAGNSFPGDHGIMAMIFAAFMLTFGDRLTRIVSLVLVACAVAPRIMVGAHWLSDILVGSLSITLLLLPWVLCTPLARKSSATVSRYVERGEKKLADWRLRRH